MAISEPFLTTSRSNGWTVTFLAKRYRSPTLLLKIDARNGAPVLTAPPAAPVPRMISPFAESTMVLCPSAPVNCRKSLAEVSLAGARGGGPVAPLHVVAPPPTQRTLGGDAAGPPHRAR